MVVVVDVFMISVLIFLTGEILFGSGSWPHSAGSLTLFMTVRSFWSKGAGLAVVAS